MSRSVLNMLAHSLFALSLCSCATGPVAQLPQIRKQAVLHTERGVAAFSRGDRDLALEEFGTSYRLNASLEHQEGMAAALVNLSRLHRLGADVEKARREAEEALSLKPSSPMLVSEIHFELAKISIASGSFNEARQWAEKGLSTSGEERGSRFLNLLAQLDVRDRSFDRGEQRAVAALKSSSGSGEREEETNARLLLAEIMLVRGEATRAAELYNVALETGKELGSSNKIAASLRGLAEASRAKGDRSAALDYFKRAYSVSLHSGETKEAAGDLLRIAGLHREKGETAEAERARNEGERLLERK